MSRRDAVVAEIAVMIDIDVAVASIAFVHVASIAAHNFARAPTTKCLSTSLQAPIVDRYGTEEKNYLYKLYEIVNQLNRGKTLDGKTGKRENWLFVRTHPE